MLVARTDAEAATLLQSNTDKRDHPLILGVTNPVLQEKHLTILLNEATTAGKAGPDLQAIKKARWLRPTCQIGRLSHYEACTLAAKLGTADVFWDLDLHLTREGFYCF
ncbi:hypothetical protein L7F22_020812 [Adiantum nelumboides]|nr:hypothetical protein [Adiantum nelumboides]